jgi:hypothetical protein
MKSFLKIGKALSFALCMTVALALFAGCDKDRDDLKDKRDGYAGTWKIDETVRYLDGSTDTDTYNVTITKSSANTVDIVMNNLLDMGAGISVIASTNGNSFTIGQQTVSTAGIGLSGSGRLNGNGISYDVLATVPGLGQVTFSCTGVKL